MRVNFKQKYSEIKKGVNNAAMMFKKIHHLSIYKNLAACLPLPSLTDFSSSWWGHLMPASSLCISFILDFPTPDIVHAFHLNMIYPFPLPVQTHLLSFLSNQPTIWKGAHVFSSAAPPSAFSSNLISHFLSFHLPSIPLFLSSSHLWSLSSSSLSTSDPPFPHHPMLWSLCSPSCDVPVWELLVQEPACVVALGQRWHRPAGMRGNRVWAFLYKRTIKPTLVHNELILIQVRCTSCILAFRPLSFRLIID